MSTMKAQAPSLKAALAELVALKDLKARAEALNTSGSPRATVQRREWLIEYDRRKPIAWEAARASLAAAEGPGDAPAESAAFEHAMREAWRMLPLIASGAPGSYARGVDSGIETALKTVRDNFERALAASAPAPSVVQAEPLPSFIRRPIEEAIDRAVNPKGMGVHDGKIHGLASDKVAYLLAAYDRLAAAAPPAPAVAPLPSPGSPEASAMLDSLLAEYGWPANAKNAARAGYEAARRMLQGTPPRDSEPLAAPETEQLAEARGEAP